MKIQVDNNGSGNVDDRLLQIINARNGAIRSANEEFLPWDLSEGTWTDKYPMIKKVIHPSLFATSVASKSGLNKQDIAVNQLSAAKTKFALNFENSAFVLGYEINFKKIDLTTSASPFSVTSRRAIMRPYVDHRGITFHNSGVDIQIPGAACLKHFPTATLLRTVAGFNNLSPDTDSTISSPVFFDDIVDTYLPDTFSPRTAASSPQTITITPTAAVENKSVTILTGWATLSFTFAGVSDDVTYVNDFVAAFNVAPISKYAVATKVGTTIVVTSLTDAFIMGVEDSLINATIVHNLYALFAVWPSSGLVDSYFGPRFFEINSTEVVKNVNIITLETDLGNLLVDRATRQLLG